MRRIWVLAALSLLCATGVHAQERNSPPPNCSDRNVNCVIDDGPPPRRPPPQHRQPVKPTIIDSNEAQNNYLRNQTAAPRTNNAATRPSGSGGSATR